MTEPGREIILGLLIRQWASIWRVSDLSDVRIFFSDRLRRSAGRCQPALGRIVLQSRLRAAPDLMTEVLCHELAHVAAHRLFGSRVAPHGIEWRSLMKAAGYDPRVRTSHRIRSVDSRSPRARVLFAHRCAVCQMLKVAKRPMRTWRCAGCLAAGLDGTLLIERRKEHAGKANG
jgi:SprT protein